MNLSTCATSLSLSQFCISHKILLIVDDTIGSHTLHCSTTHYTSPGHMFRSKDTHTRMGMAAGRILNGYKDFHNCQKVVSLHLLYESLPDTFSEHCQSGNPPSQTGMCHVVVKNEMDEGRW